MGVCVWLGETKASDGYQGIEGTPGKKARHDSRSWFRAIRRLSDWLRSDEDIVLG